jgi:hypothetical protein
MSSLNMGGFVVPDAGDSGSVSIPKAAAGAVAGALAMGIVYGIIGRVLHVEYSYVAFLIGAASGVAAMKLGGGRSVVAGGIAAGATLVGVLLGKVIIGSPEGTSFLAYHTTMFDIIFCYLAAPAAGFFAAGSNQARALLKHLPF